MGGEDNRKGLECRDGSLICLVASEGVDFLDFSKEERKSGQSLDGEVNRKRGRRSVGSEKGLDA